MMFLYKKYTKLNIFLICVHKYKVTLDMKQMKYILSSKIQDESKGLKDNCGFGIISGAKLKYRTVQLRFVRFAGQVWFW